MRAAAKKTLWLIFVILVPFLGVFVYLIANSDDMARRNMEPLRRRRAEMDDYVRTVGRHGGAAAEIERAKGLLDSGAITPGGVRRDQGQGLA